MNDDPAKPGSLIVLTGPPGAGKSTVAAILIQRYTLAVHLHADDFWHFIGSGAIPPYLPEANRQNAVVITALARAAAAYAREEFLDEINTWIENHLAELSPV